MQKLSMKTPRLSALFNYKLNITIGYLFFFGNLRRIHGSPQERIPANRAMYIDALLSLDYTCKKSIPLLPAH